MENCKKLLLKIFFLPYWATLLVALPSFVLVIYTLASGTRAGVLAYASYVVSAYSLVLVGTAVFRIVRDFKQKQLDVLLIGKIRSNPLGEQYLTDHVFRTQIGLYLGFLMNVFYIFLKVLTGIATSSAWLIASGIYYFALTWIRYPLVRHMRHSGSPEIACHRSKMCGVFLLGLNLALSGIVVMMITENQHYEYPGMLIYAMAAYTFYIVTISIINLVRFRKYQDSILSAIKAVSLTAALVSMLTLETAMFSQFGQSSSAIFKHTMIALTGGAICVVTTSIAIVMIVRANKRLKLLKNNIS